MKITKGKTYYAKHLPSGEEWLVLGINQAADSVCVAGWPPTRARLSDCVDLKEAGDLTEPMIAHRQKEFGNNWDN